MGFTVRYLLSVFGLILLITTIATSAEHKISKRRATGLPCIWHCPIILDRCLLEGRRKSTCNRVLQQCNRICLEDKPNAMGSKIKRSFNWKKHCKLTCDGYFKQCKTVVITREAFVICVKAKTKCNKEC